MQNPEIFEGTTFQDLQKEIHSLATHRRNQITAVMDTLAALITNVNDAAVIAPLVKDYMDVNVRSDEALIKLATIQQRLMVAEKLTSSGGNDLLTDDEKEALLASIREEQEQAGKEVLETLAVTIEKRLDIDEDLAALNKKTEKALDKLMESDES